MDIMLRTRFDNVERAEACVKRIREADCAVTEIRLIAPEHRDSGRGVFAAIPVMSTTYPGTIGYGGGTFALGAVNSGTDGEPENDDVHNSDAVVEIVAPPHAEDKIRSIVINAGGRDTVVF
ncbi:MAG: hypothetical protein ACERKO_06915 [Acetanaerobacterium sp.]